MFDKVPKTQRDAASIWRAFGDIRIMALKVSSAADDGPASEKSWPRAIYEIFKALGIRQVPYVPDGGHAELIELIHADGEIKPLTLTTEEEGIAVLAGAWLGGQRVALLMQSRGVGNCMNMLSLVKTCRFPFFTLVTMRGEWGEFNPWQVPMGSTSQSALELMDVRVLRVRRREEVAETVSAGAQMAFLGGTPTAVLLSQELVGSKVFVN
jgi:sulfopyruvate decarboxylase alpha subunit